MDSSNVDKSTAAEPDSSGPSADPASAPSSPDEVFQQIQRAVHSTFEPCLKIYRHCYDQYARSDSIISHLRNEVITLQDSNEKLKREEAALKAANEKLGHEAIELRGKEEELQQKIDRAYADLDLKQIELRDINRALETNARTSEVTIKELEADVKKLESTITNLEAEVKESETAIRDLEAKTMQSEITIDDLEAKAQESEITIRALETKTTELEAIVQKLREALSESTQLLGATDQKCVEITTRVENQRENHAKELEETKRNIEEEWVNRLEALQAEGEKSWERELARYTDNKDLEVLKVKSEAQADLNSVLLHDTEPSTATGILDLEEILPQTKRRRYGSPMSANDDDNSPSSSHNRGQGRKEDGGDLSLNHQSIPSPDDAEPPPKRARLDPMASSPADPTVVGNPHAHDTEITAEQGKQPSPSKTVLSPIIPSNPALGTAFQQRGSKNFGMLLDQKSSEIEGTNHRFIGLRASIGNAQHAMWRLNSHQLVKFNSATYFSVRLSIKECLERWVELHPEIFSQTFDIDAPSQCINSKLMASRQAGMVKPGAHAQIA